MNKTQYLINKGRIPDPAKGSMWIVKSTRTGVTMYELPVWEVMDSSFNRSTWNPAEKTWSESQVINQKIYIFKDSPYEVAIEEGMSYGKEEGHGTGFGDLWSWSYFGSFDKAVAQKIYEDETHRVQMTYMLNI